MNPNLTQTICGTALLCAALNLNLAYAAEGPNAPAVAPTAPGTNAPAGPRGGGRGPQVPLSDADQAEIAKLADLPPWTPGAGDGSYFVGPMYTPAP